MNDQFVTIFRQRDVDPARGKFLSRVFGIFSEEIVRIWANDIRSPYSDLGRPTLRQDIREKGHTLDFTLQDKQSGKTFVTELKCEIEYQNYRYLELTGVQQLEHHKKDAFTALLSIAKGLSNYKTYVQAEELTVDGAILIWGVATPEGRQDVIQKCGFADLLTIAEMVSDLSEWKNEEYQAMIRSREQWSSELFNGLLR
jgi:hypothetical protein